MPNKVNLDSGSEPVFAAGLDDDTAAEITEGFARTIPAPGIKPRLDAIMKRLLADLAARGVERDAIGVMTEVCLDAYTRHSGERTPEGGGW